MHRRRARSRWRRPAHLYRMIRAGRIARGRRSRPAPKAGYAGSRTRRRAHFRQGFVRRGGQRHARGIDCPARGRTRTRRCSGGRAAARGGRGDRRQDEHDRVCLFRSRLESEFRHALEPIRPGRETHPRRILLGGGGVGKRWHGRRRLGDGHRGLHPYSGGAVRSRGLEADRRTHIPARRVAVVDLARFGRTDRSGCGLLCAHRCGVERRCGHARASALVERRSTGAARRVARRRHRRRGGQRARTRTDEHQQGRRDVGRDGIDADRASAVGGRRRRGRGRRGLCLAPAQSCSARCAL